MEVFRLAVFEVIVAGITIQVGCNRCGKTNMFKHAPKLLTCNGCGHTFQTIAEATPVIEQVVQVSNE